jgi:toxin ParE1/3/4
MSRAVRTPIARQDLKGIGRHIAGDSGSRDVALRFLDVLERKIATYATQPELGERRPDLGAEVRCFPVGSYVVFYRARKDDIEVLRVLHGSRDIPSVWRNRPQR